MANQKFLLNPNETAMENLYRAADYATRYILSKKKLALRSSEEWADLHNLFMHTTVQMFLDRYIRQKSYSRKYSFFQNVYGAAWGCCTMVVTAFMDEIKSRLSNTDHMETLSFDSENHPLRGIGTVAKTTELTEVERQALGFKHLKKWDAEDALNYIWACEDEAAAYEHKCIDYAANLEHRKHVLDRLHKKMFGGLSEARINKLKYHHEYHKKRKGL